MEGRIYSWNETQQKLEGEGEVGKSVATPSFHVQHGLKIIHSTAVSSSQEVPDNHTIIFRKLQI